MSPFIILFANKMQAGNKIANYHADLVCKAKLHIQIYYDLLKLSAPERAIKVQWLLQKDRCTCPMEMRDVICQVSMRNIAF